MNFKLKLGLVSLSYLSRFNSKSNIQDEFWNLEIKSFPLAPRFLGLNALLMKKSPPKDSTEVLSPPLYYLATTIHNLAPTGAQEMLIVIVLEYVQMFRHM